MVSICPTITAYDLHQYREQIDQVVGFTKRLHIDLMDGVFTETISPPIDQLWLPGGIVNDVHLMYEQPVEVLPVLLALKPDRVIVQAESQDAEKALVILKQTEVKAGIAILAGTEVASLGGILEQADYVLIFSGHLGYHGGEADMSLLRKVHEIRLRNPAAEIAWDGGINAENAQELKDGGIDVLNVGAFIQRAPVPGDAYAILQEKVNA